MPSPVSRGDAPCTGDVPTKNAGKAKGSGGKVKGKPKEEKTGRTRKIAPGSDGDSAAGEKKAEEGIERITGEGDDAGKGDSGKGEPMKNETNPDGEKREETFGEKKDGTSLENIGLGKAEGPGPARDEHSEAGTDGVSVSTVNDAWSLGSFGPMSFTEALVEHRRINQQRKLIGAHVSRYGTIQLVLVTLRSVRPCDHDRYESFKFGKGRKTQRGWTIVLNGARQPGAVEVFRGSAEVYN